jgi:predicted DNA-binding transcriptional regulator YafY
MPTLTPPPCSPATDLRAQERLHHLIEWLRSGRQLTTPLAAEAFGVSRRTIARDLAHVRGALGLEVDFDPAHNSYVLAEEHAALPYLAFPTLAPILLDGHPAAGQPDHERRRPIDVRYSAHAVRAYLARGGRVPDGTLNEDGTLDVSFMPHNLDEFMSYVLSRGHAIEVLGPPAFRSRVRMEIRRMLALYRDAPPPES